MESSLKVEFVSLDAKPIQFFDFLPEDWRVDIAPVWDRYRTNSHIYGLIDVNKRLVGGGIVFKTVSPDIIHAAELAQGWLDDGYDYMAYLYIDEKYRGNGLGKLWIRSVIEQHPDQKYWLTIDEFGLKDFYQKLGFVLGDEIQSEYGSEWVLSFQP